MSLENENIKDKIKWERINILLKPLGGLFTGIAIALVGFFTTNMLETQQAEETNRRLYIEIMSSREKADSDLRKEMFNSIIKAFLDPEKAKLPEKVLALELLAYNFHDILDLSPLFKYVAVKIDATTFENNPTEILNFEKKTSLKLQLQKVAREVIGKQLASLAEGGIRQTLYVDFKTIDDEDEQILIDEIFPLRYNDPELKGQRYIRVAATKVFPGTQEIKIHLESGYYSDSITPDTLITNDIFVEFKVGFFDFPMIDNTRVSHSQRIGIALINFGKTSAKLSLVYFPESRASLKEKPYYDDVIENLRRKK